MFSVRYFAAAVVLTSTSGAVTAQSLPGLENFSIEQQRPPAPTATAAPAPTPAATPPAATATPAPTPTAAPSGLPPPAPSPSPSTSRSPAARPSAAPTAAPGLAPGTGPTAIDSPAPQASATPSPVATAAPEAQAPVEAGWPWWWLALAAGAIGAGAFAWARRRRRADDEVWDEPAIVDPEGVEPSVPPPAASPIVATPIVAAPPAPPSPPPAASPIVSTPIPKPLGGLVTSSLKPAIAIRIEPQRAAVDSLRATLEYVLHIANTGQAPAYAVAVETWLSAAGSNPAAEIEQLLALPPGEPQLPPFDLPPSAQGDLAAQSIAPRETLAVINAGERKIFVPMLSVRAHYFDRRGQLQVATAAFLIGAERDGQERLAPLALDRGSRSYDRLGARPFGD